jgi:hypothetical protein
VRIKTPSRVTAGVASDISPRLFFATSWYASPGSRLIVRPALGHQLGDVVVSVDARRRLFEGARTTFFSAD